MVNIEKEIAELHGMKTHELRIRWRHCYRAEPSPGLSRDLLSRGIAYKIQENAHGGLTQSTKRKLRALAKTLASDGPTSLGPALRLKPGVKLVRAWRNYTHTVIVRDDGFEYDGEPYRSLTQIARKITGAHWSGPRFFGLKTTTQSIGSAEVTHE